MVQVERLRQLLPGMGTTLRRMKPAELVRMAAQLEEVGGKGTVWLYGNATAVKPAELVRMAAQLEEVRTRRRNDNAVDGLS